MTSAKLSGFWTSPACSHLVSDIQYRFHATSLRLFGADFLGAEGRHIRMVLIYGISISNNMIYLFI